VRYAETPGWTVVTSGSSAHAWPGLGQLGEVGGQHVVEVEKIHRPGPGATYPRCSAGNRACPPEDCGGPPGYYDMLRALRARNGPRYREIREWLGGRYDPAAFDLALVNQELARCCGQRP